MKTGKHANFFVSYERRKWCQQFKVKIIARKRANTLLRISRNISQLILLDAMNYSLCGES